MATFGARLPSLLAAVIGCLGVLAPLPAQLVRADPEMPVDARAQHVDRLCVKFAEGTGAQWRDGRLVSRTGVDLGAIARWFELADAEPLIAALSWEQLDAMHAHAATVLPEGRRPGHMGLWFRLRTKSLAQALELRAALAAEPLVADVYFEPRWLGASAAPLPTGGDLPPTTPSFASQQGTHGPSPAGHSLRPAAGVYGARGQGQRVYMIEGTFLFGHEDVSKVTPANVIGPVPTYNQTTGLHGLSGASLLCADRNAYGITGVADEVTLRLMDLDLNGGLEASMLIASNDARVGDLLMAVLMVQVPGLGPGSFLPIEFYQATFDATLTVTAAGRHVVLPAGNGSRSLDDPMLLGRFDRSFRDSGAILCGASLSGPLQRAPFSNWGSRIDAHSWGENIVSCGYGTLFFPNNDMLQSYTAAAAGTSSSTPHVAGIVAMLQGAAKHQRGALLTSSQLLAALHTYGPQTPDVIGRRVDVTAALTGLGMMDGLRLDVPDVDLGGTVTATMEAPAGSIIGLYGSLTAADFAIGFNRNVHVDLFALVPLGAFFLPAGTATWSWTVPNSASVQGVSLYLQGVRLSGSNPLYVTNSCQVTIL